MRGDAGAEARRGRCLQRTAEGWTEREPPRGCSSLRKQERGRGGTQAEEGKAVGSQDRETAKTAKTAKTARTAGNVELVGGDARGAQHAGRVERGAGERKGKACCSGACYRGVWARLARVYICCWGRGVAWV